MSDPKEQPQALEGVYTVDGYCEECRQDTEPFVLLPVGVMLNAAMNMITVFVGALCPVCHTIREQEKEFDDLRWFYERYPKMERITELLKRHKAALAPIGWPTQEMKLSYEERAVLANAIRVLAEQHYRAEAYYLPRLAMDKDLSDALGNIL